MKKKITLILFILTILSFFSTHVAYFLRIITNHFAVGLSTAKVQLFLIWSIVLITFNSNKKSYIGQALVINIITCVGSNLYIFLKYGLPWLGQYNFFYKGIFSSTSIGHQHIMKYVSNIFQKLTNLPVFRYVDSGSTFQEFIPYWIQIFGALGIIFLAYSLYQEYKKHNSLIYIIASFSVLKNFIDGGFLNFEGSFWLFVLLSIIYYKKRFYFIPILIIPFILFWSKTIYLAPFIIIFGIIIYHLDKVNNYHKISLISSYIIVILLLSPSINNIIYESVYDLKYLSTSIQEKEIFIQHEAYPDLISIQNTSGTVYEIAEKNNLKSHYARRIFIPGVNCQYEKRTRFKVAIRTSEYINLTKVPDFLNVEVERVDWDKYYAYIESKHNCFYLRSLIPIILYENDVNKGIFTMYYDS